MEKEKLGKGRVAGFKEMDGTVIDLGEFLENTDFGGRGHRLDCNTSREVIER